MNQFVTRGLLPALSLVLAGIAMAADTAPAATPAAATPAAATPKSTAATGAKSDTADSDQDKALYALGVLLSRNLDSFTLSEAEFAHVKAGIVDGFHHKPSAATAEASLPQIQALQRTRAMALAAHQKEAGQAYLDKAAAAPGATKTGSGMLYIAVAAGSGPSPTHSDRVKVNYEGRLIDGTVFDSSAQHGQPATLSVGGIIPCWTEALQLMKVGGKSRIICPAALAYGDRGAPPKIKPGASLEFDIELLSIEAPPPAANTGPKLPGAAGAVLPAPPAETPAAPKGP
ncbi:MAG TPA: FKBP-type peptidyl-prolyl cis-trans isomerase [Steroidobacteraceae bacterium]|jgi:FKBP-type peptidyl-prolyl cis-trans isomerase FkpA|nr:FKBP-type peptidyl-prolyl cis-trans isomerase [Steroidobacteraceae bacterium]